MMNIWTAAISLGHIKLDKPNPDCNCARCKIPEELIRPLLSDMGKAEAHYIAVCVADEDVEDVYGTGIMKDAVQWRENARKNLLELIMTPLENTQFREQLAIWGWREE